MSNSHSCVVSPKVRLLAAALSLALPAAHAASSGSLPNGNTLRKPLTASMFDLHRMRTAFGDYAKQAPKSNAPQRAPTTRAILSTADAGAGSLREALTSAVDGDVIDLAGLTGTIRLSSPLEATAKVTINGPGEHLLMLQGSGHDRVLQSAHDLHVSHVTIAGGTTSLFTPPIGGCLYVTGNLYLQNTTVTGCTAAGPNVAYGGAIAALGTAVLKYSTVSNSSASTDGGYLAGGGGVIGGHALVLLSSTVTGNSVAQSNGTTTQNLAVGGGAVAGNSTSTNAYVVYSTISGNTVSTSGGTYYDPVTMTTTSEYGIGLGGGLAALGNTGIIASTVSGNTADANGQAWGGGAFFGKYAEILGSAVSNNTANSSAAFSYGGGVMAMDALVVGGSALNGNQGTSTCSSCFIGGGAIFSYGKPLSVQSSTFSGNALRATGGPTAAGGAIAVGYAAGSASAVLTNSTITGNSVEVDPASGGNGAGMWIGGPLTLNNSTVAFNTSSSFGGGITLYAGATNTLYSSIVANNTATGDATTNDLFSSTNATIAGSNSLVMAAGANITLPAGTLTADPMLKPLAFNGGLTQTLALDPASPAVDTGLSPPSLTQDQRGFARVVGASADIGAYELDTDRIFSDAFGPLLQ